MALLLKNIRVIDPQQNLDQVCDVIVRDGKYVQLGQDLSIPKGLTRDMTGHIMVPGLMDMHVHFRDPGFEEKEDIESGSRAAAHGGFTAVLQMPNTKPTIDNAAMVEYVNKRAEEVAKCRVYVSGACTVGREGKIMTEMGDMVRAGAVAFSDDGSGIADTGVMRRMMDYAHQFGTPILEHCQDKSLVGDGQVNEGAASTRLAVEGWPAAGEEVEIARDIELCRLTGTPLHIQHVTTAHGLDLIRQAKADGLPVTCEVTPHHLFLNENALDETYDTNLKVNPPLRTQADNDALVRGVIDGTVDCIVTDHAPHTAWEKDEEFERAPFGMTGLETSLGLVLTQLVNTGVIDYNRMIELMAINPRKILRLDPVTIAEGQTADFTIIDPDAEWVVSVDDFYSKGKNSGFIGAQLKGRATDTYVGGYATMEDGKVQ